MEIELEAKFLDINPVELRKKLRQLGAKLIYPEQLMSRKNFDYPDHRLEKIGGWIRVRDEKDSVTLAYKQLVSRRIEGTKEISLKVDNFGNICKFLKAIGLVDRSYQETKREKWFLKDVEITIDTWPWIPSFVELEGMEEQQLRAIASKLKIDWSKALHGSVEIVYQNYYDVTEQEVDSWKRIIFSPVPKWLKKRQKNKN